MDLNIKNDITLSIATGRGRWEKKWRNIDMLWSEMVKKLSNTHHTAETYNAYIKLKKTRQDEIKDIGGFVGGYVANGKRRKGNITFRSVITLDLDYADMKMFDDFKLIYGYAACVYSTHKHTEKKPRLRLVIPLKDTVTSDMYEPIARKIAEWIGIEMFDDTTYQDSRLMYWPSTCKDGTFYFDYCDGDLLDGHKVLEEYHDWTDISSWPMSSRVDKIIGKALKKQENPHDKKGLIGAFCKAYTITEAIEHFLSDVYFPCDIENRYTFNEGSTSAGLVIYEDLFAFSHHGTDPCSMRLCNAFDLVRAHKFGHLDENTQEDTPINRRPSYVSMTKLIAEDKNSKQILIKEQLQEASKDFEGIDASKFADDDWVGKLDVNDNNKIRSTIDNVISILNNDPNLINSIAYNEFEKMVTVRKDLPWRKISVGNTHFTDTDESGFRHYLEKLYQVTGAKKIEDAINLVTRQHSYHPVKEYLNSLTWDGSKRLETVFVDYLGAEDSEYTRKVTKKALVACVARILNPGCKFDTVLTLVGKQGTGKSTILARLGGEWYNENVTLFNITKETADLIQGSWIIELGELVGFKKAEEETVKNFISRTEDKYRKAYGRNTDRFPRQCVFFGTTNERLFLKDPTGNRRWWPVETGINKSTKDVFEDMDSEEVGQIWAEAIKFYNAGERLHLDKETYKKATAVQEEFNEHNEKIGLIEEFLKLEIPHNWEELNQYDKRDYITRDNDDTRWSEAEMVERKRVCVAAIWCELFNGDLKMLRKNESNELVNCLRKIKGWKEHKNPVRFKEYGRQKAFIKVAIKGGNHV